MSGTPDRGVERWPRPTPASAQSRYHRPGCGHVRGGTSDLQLLGCPGVAQPQSSREAIQ